MKQLDVQTTRIFSRDELLSVNEIIRSRTSSPIARRKWWVSKQNNPQNTTRNGTKSATPKLVIYILSVLSNLRELYTKCWLIQQNRGLDVLEYEHTKASYFEEEAGLEILCDWRVLKFPQSIPAKTLFTLRPPQEHNESILYALKIALGTYGCQSREEGNVQ